MWYFSPMDNLNPIQLKILSTLLFNPKARFRDLNTDSMPTDHFSYHLRVLLGLGLVKKEKLTYTLTSKGKMLASKIDTPIHKMEKQPKVSVILIPHKTVRGKERFLIQQRTKEPYFGYKGFISGKVRFGETLQETAERELKEESGIGGKFRFRYEIHEMVYDKATGEQLEDKFFHIIECTQITGKVIKKTAEGINQFVTVGKFRKMRPKYHNEDDMLTWFLEKDFKFKEQKYLIESF
jgi:8-oxo-dGTP pyrophosphatase MutT (NUDIX family)